MAVQGTFYKQTRSPVDNVFPDIATGRVRTWTETVVIDEAGHAAADVIRLGAEKLNPGSRILSIASLGATGFTSITADLFWATDNYIKVDTIVQLTSTQLATEITYPVFSAAYTSTTARVGNLALTLASNEGLDLAAVLTIGITYVTD